MTISEMLSMFPSATKHQIEKARKQASLGQAGIPLEPGKYYRNKLTNHQINHFLDFVQFSGLIQDVASGTSLLKLSTKKTVAMPNVIRTVHKGIRLKSSGYMKVHVTVKDTTKILAGHQQGLYGTFFKIALPVRERVKLV